MEEKGDGREVLVIRVRVGGVDFVCFGRFKREIFLVVSEREECRFADDPRWNRWDTPSRDKLSVKVCSIVENSASIDFCLQLIRKARNEEADTAPSSHCCERGLLALRPVMFHAGYVARLM